MSTTLGRARSVALIGLEGADVTVDAYVGPGLPGLQVIGMQGASDAGQRVRVALQRLGVRLPGSKILVSLSPADVSKAGARYDLAIAVAVLAALGVVPVEAAESTAFLGELALDGGLRAVSGVVPSAVHAARRDVRLAVPQACGGEAALAGGDVLVLDGLDEAVDVLVGDRPARRADPPEVTPADGPVPDLADVVGQEEARRALEIAAAGGHHLLLIGPPGCGKSMLARRLAGLLPPLNQERALDLAAVRSLVGMPVAGPDGAVDRRPPFRAPHHRSSPTSLLGGGSGLARPGELSLANGGVLFLDELLEWPRGMLEALREPLEEGVVRIARTKGVVNYPARVQLVAAANPCPCGGGEQCLCPDEKIWAYRARLSGPLADRLDLAPAVRPLRGTDLLGEPGGEPTSAVAARVGAARDAAAARGVGRNAEAPVAMLRRQATRAALRLLAEAVERGELTGRGHDRALRVARTIADLDGAEAIASAHVLEALAHRVNLRAGMVSTP